MPPGAQFLWADLHYHFYFIKLTANQPGMIFRDSIAMINAASRLSVETTQQPFF
jgi:hypothetical protein